MLFPTIAKSIVGAGLGVSTIAVTAISWPSSANSGKIIAESNSSNDLTVTDEKGKNRDAIRTDSGALVTTRNNGQKVVLEGKVVTVREEGEKCDKLYSFEKELQKWQQCYLNKSI